MKKVFILATAAIVALASCAKTQVVYNGQPEEIAFKQITGAMTKATALGDDVKMGVFAEYDGTSYFANKSFGMKMVDAVKVWAGDSPQYWPYEGTLDFTVYAPHGNATYESSVLEVTGVTAGEGILYGQERYCDKNKASDSGKIPVVLKHACAKISVILKSNVADVFTVKNLTFNAVKVGTYTVNYGSGPSVTATGSSVPYDLVETDIPLTNAGSPLDDVYVLPGDQTAFNIEFSQAGITTFSKTIDLSGEKWVANNHYTYTITITADEILLDPVVAEWDTPLGDYNYGNADLN